MDNGERWPNDVLDRIQRELAGAETPLYLLADDVLRVLEAAEAVPSADLRGAVPRERVEAALNTVPYMYDASEAALDYLRAVLLHGSDL